MTADHYFSAEPAAPAETRQIEFDMAGERLRLAAASGVFSATRLDLGTALLLRKATLPTAATIGNIMDLGCGYGPIAITLARAAPRATVYAVDVNRRALDLVRRNADAHDLPNIVAVEPDEVDPAITFGQLWSNPPIRIGKGELHLVLRRWLPHLSPDGVGWLVVARNLGADSLQQWLAAEGWQVARHASGKGYRILKVAGKSGDDGGVRPQNH